MDKKKKKKNQVILSPEQSLILQQSFITELDSNPEFSLDADPEGKLKMSTTQKDFIRHYIQFKSVGSAADLAGITMDEAKLMFVDYKVQNEIRRINRALYQRQFASKLISVDAIGGYLSSLLTGDNVPIADQLKTGEKLRVVELLLRLNELKAGMTEPDELMKSDISVQIKNLSIATIQQLLIQNNNINEKNRLISSVDDGSLTMEDKSYLQSLPLPELLQLIEETNKETKHEDK